mmetsp:Transcript_75312/g.215645  ORF Transcript_75312/g.215645 Transcript_75312/m.215645 type:complete len:238 (+) Transcript_75312:33-746(+)
MLSCSGQGSSCTCSLPCVGNARAMNFGQGLRHSPREATSPSAHCNHRCPKQQPYQHVSSTGFLLIALLHHHVLLRDVVEHGPLAGLLQLARDDDLVEDVVGLVEVEDQVQLAHVAEVAVQALHEVVDGLESEQLVVVGLDAGDEEEAGVALVADLVVAPLEEVAGLRRPIQDEVADLLDGPELITLQARDKPLLQPRLALTADEQHVLDHLEAGPEVQTWNASKVGCSANSARAGTT